MPIDPTEFVERQPDWEERREEPVTPLPPSPAQAPLEEVPAGGEAEDRAPPPPAPFAPPPAPPPRRGGLAGEGMIKLLDGLVELTTGVPPQIPESLRSLAAEVLESLDFPAGIPTHRISPSARWKWGLAIIGAYTGLALFGAIRLRRALAQMQRQGQAPESPPAEPPTDEPPPPTEIVPAPEEPAGPTPHPETATVEPFAVVPLPEGVGDRNLTTDTTSSTEGHDDTDRDDSGTGPSA